MSATTRRRNGKNKNKSKKRGRNRSTARPAAPPALFGLAELDAGDGCDCPACSGAGLELDVMLQELTAELAGFDDPLDAEIAGALVVSTGADLGQEEFEQAVVEGLIPEFEAHATAGAVALLCAIAAVAPRRGAAAAAAAAERLAVTGLSRPRWAAELAQPVTVSDCVRVHDTQDSAAVLACTFHRGGRAHAFLLSVDELDCGAASDIGVLDADQLPDALDAVRAAGRDGGFEIVTDALDPAEFRWQVENALDARAVHDRDPIEASLPVDVDEEGPGYPALALLLRARMATLPAPSKPPAAHRGDAADGLAALQMLAQLFEPGQSAARPAGSRPRRSRTRPLPAKRAKPGQPAPGYQIKVGLRGAQPPIWRRLEVPADISLARLHQVIQVAFDWEDDHLHVFRTPYGEFGTRDRELGHRSEAAVTLEQVAPKPGSTISYTYDFGDDWEHTIVVEKRLEPTQASRAPRCTGGRRAAPPDDCGGIWGYAELAEIIADPAHPEHAERLDWLGLDDPADFDPARFNATTITRRLASIR